MNVEDLLRYGYFPKELPPCFTTELLAKRIDQINTILSRDRDAALNLFVNSGINDIPATEQAEERTKRKIIFNNRTHYSDCSLYNIPRSGISRNTIKVPNPLHQSKLSEEIAKNFNLLSSIYNKSKISSTKPTAESERGEGKRAVKHDDYKTFKEKCITGSFKYSVRLKTDISNYYPSIYTHSIPWVTFGGKEIYKKNRALGSSRLRDYGDDLDDRLTWCQNQQTKGIPIGPDSSFLIAELIGCHIDVLLETALKKKKLDFIGNRYYDDYNLYFTSELEAQIGLSEFKSILNEFELKVNDKKTTIEKANNDLENDWALAIKTFYFSPYPEDQRERIWNYFALVFSLATKYPEKRVLPFALNKFNYIRIERENWDFFESLIFRLGLTDTSSLQKIAKLLTTYKTLLNKPKLKDFCLEIIKRNCDNKHDYELTWSLFLLSTFKIQPTKAIFDLVFKSQSVFASIIALDLINKNKVIKISSFDFSSISSLICTENLNDRNWIVAYEAVYKQWIPGVSKDIIENHFYFNILESEKVHFYNAERKLQPIKVNSTKISEINRKLHSLKEYAIKNKIGNKKVLNGIKSIVTELKLQDFLNKDEFRKRLSEADNSIKRLINDIEKIEDQLKEFNQRQSYFGVRQKLVSIHSLTQKEIDLEAKKDNDLLFDPDYDD